MWFHDGWSDILLTIYHSHIINQDQVQGPIYINILLLKENLNLKFKMVIYFQTDSLQTTGTYNYATHSFTLNPPEHDGLDFYCEFDNVHGHEDR